jgi:geranylgeranyl diphosphate synthase type I
MNPHPEVDYLDDLKNSVDAEIRRILDKNLKPRFHPLYEMMEYQMGWSAGSIHGIGGGKRLRPIFLLLACQAEGGEWREALPAAAAVELLHNFSLIHDDIQDQSEMRHGRPTIWKKWNTALAINAGDTMFSLANLALMELMTNKPPEMILGTQRVMFETCIQLTHGQHLDISNEGLAEISIEDYLEMIEGKTAALIGASMQMGVILAGSSQSRQDMANRLGRSIGMAFQIIDDILGIWGETGLTGKSNESDLISRKLSLPIIYGIGQNDAFARRWRQGALTSDEIPGAVAILENEGAWGFADSMAKDYTIDALTIYNKLGFQNEAALVLKELFEGLITRKY